MFKEIPDQETLIIMIDSNIYTDENLVCYNEFINGIFDEEGNALTANNAIIDFLQKKQEDLIRTFLSSDKIYKNIIICAHHPLMGFKNQTVKEKNGNMKKKKEVLNHIALNYMNYCIM